MMKTHQQPAFAESALGVLIWIAIVLLMIALMSNVALGENPPPKQLSPNVMDLATPMSAAETGTQEAQYDACIAMWRAIHFHEEGMYDEAVTEWNVATLPADHAEWRFIGKGAAQLNAGELEGAIINLKIAVQHGPENPAAHYLLGRALLEQSRRVPPLYYDAGPIVRFAVWTTQDGSPYAVHNPLLESEAMQEFEAAITHAGHLNMDALLAPMHWGDTPNAGLMPIAPPTIGEVSEALHVDNVAARSHAMLGAIHLQRGQLNHTNLHFDQAGLMGIDVAVGYQALADAYADLGDEPAAAKANLRGSEHHGSEWETFNKMIREITVR